MDFNSLQDLARIINKNKIKKIEVLGNDAGAKSNVSELYDGLCNDFWKNEEEIMMHFFKNKDAKNEYSKLKNRLIQQLVNTAFFIDATNPMFQDRENANIICYRNLVAARLLFPKDARRAAIILLETTLEQAIKYEFTEMVVEICRLLSRHSSDSISDEKNLEKYFLLQKEYEFKLNWEIIAIDYLKELSKYYINHKTPNQEIYEKALNYHEQLVPKLSEIDTSVFYNKVFLIGLIRYFSINDIQTCYDYADYAYKTLSRRKNINRGLLLSIILQKLSCEVQLKKSDDIFSENGTANICLKLSVIGSSNWFKIKEQQYYQFIHAGHYKAALDIYIEVTAINRINLLEGSPLEDWKLYGAYLQLLGTMGKLESEKVTEATGIYKLNKFLNEFNTLNKDKEGMNIPILLLPLLFNIVNKNYGDNEQYRDSLTKYKQRNLEKM
jgi:hypothetical protein